MIKRTPVYNLPLSERPSMQFIERIAGLMDSRFQLPGTRFRFGLDPIIGLIPVVGDVAGFAVSGALILYMIRFGASRELVFKMLGNAVLDATIGSIPLIGWVFDASYKANKRNIRLLKEHYHEGKHQGSGTGMLITVALILLVLLVLLIWGLVALSRWLIGLFQ
ncbi:DUF4112 domain-containing protein [Cesiribacter andamanensis]|nr:DUF4112 domain-containing protein [Cesiribacter andamanensis]